MATKFSRPSANTLTQAISAKVEAPKNGLKGLKHWRYDIPAGLLVALVSTPFSIGVAISSGAPPITGLISAIIAGLTLPFLGGSYVTVSGPAAGLAPALYGAMLALGMGNLSVGYPLLLPLIAVVGIVQVFLSGIKAARFSAWFPAPVVEGMLASIGAMIIAKQIPMLLGEKFIAKDFWGILFETPHAFPHGNMVIMMIGFGTLALLMVLSVLAKHVKLLRVFPPQIIAVVIVTLFSLPFALPQALRVNIPANPIQHGMVWPDFVGIAHRPDLWWAALGIIITLTLIDGIESLATIRAIDKIDPFHRRSNPDKTLFAMGISNICSSLVGGLTIIPGGIKSTTNISAGGRTQWANFYNACFLLAFMLLFQPAINSIPLAVTAAVLAFTGYKLCKPAIWRHVAGHGADQLTLFVFTILLTLTTDLMWGILGGVLLSLSMNAGLLWKTRIKRQRESSLISVLSDQFRSPVASHHEHEHAALIHLNRPLVCFNDFHLNEILKSVPQTITHIRLVLDEAVELIDHTTWEHLQRFILHAEASGYHTISIEGLEQFRTIANSHSATRVLHAV